MDPASYARRNPDNAKLIQVRPALGGPWDAGYTRDEATRLAEHILALASEPLNWPPQIADIWEADGIEYYVRESTINASCLMFEAFEREHSSVKADVLKDRNPVLVRRRPL